jgi:pentatricopeptide repeat domain-containing protein 1
VRGEQWQQALGPLALLQQSGLVLDVIAYSAAVSAGVKGTRRQQALDLLAMMLQSGVVPKVIAYDAAGSACAKGGHWHQPLGLLAVMLRSGLGPECNRLQHCHQCLWEGWALQQALDLGQWGACNTIAGSFIRWLGWRGKLHAQTQRSLTTTLPWVPVKGKQLQQALGPLTLMQQSGSVLDVITYDAALSAREKGAQGLQTLGILAVMQLSGLEPDVIFYNAAVSACQKGEQWQLHLVLRRWW